MIVLSDRCYVSNKTWKILSSHLKKYIIAQFSDVTVNPRNCGIFVSGRPCPTQKERGRAFCYKCPMSKQEIRLIKRTKNGVAFERGNLEKVNSIIELIKGEVNTEVKDKRIYTKEEHFFSMNWSKLKEPRKSQQKDLAKKWFSTFGYGQIVAPPRFGKTVLAVLIASLFKTKTVIIANQKELVNQFYEAFVTFTNIKEVEQLLHKQLISINPKEIKDNIVCLYTYQQFISKSGKARLEKIRNSFGLLLCDESHTSAATEYHKIVSRFSAKYKGGLSATPEHNTKVFRSNCVLGPPVLEGGDEQLSCTFKIVKTDFVIPEYKYMNNAAWNNLWTKYTKDVERNTKIAKYVDIDVRKGHKVIIPVLRIQHLTNLEEIIHARFPHLKIGVLHSKVKDKDKVISKIKKGKYDVTLAINKMVSVGFNAPPISCIYLNVYSMHSKQGAAYQEYSRIRTKMEGKKTPLIRVFQDQGQRSEKSVNFLRKLFLEKGFKDATK